MIYCLKIFNFLKFKSQEPSHTQSVKLSKKSEKILRNKLDTKLGEIFDLLDSNNDGIIQKSDIDFDLLGEEIAEMLFPLFEEIEEGENIKKSEFVDACHNLFDAFHIPQRHLNILNFGKKQAKSDEDILLEKIRNTIQQVEAKYVKNESSPAWKRLAARPIKDFNRLHELKVERNARLMKECTFHPNLVPVPKRDLPYQPSLKRRVFQ